MLAAGSLPLVVIGGLLILDDSAYAVWGWIGVGFFGACLLVSAARLVPGAASLTLDASGFEERTLFFQRPRIHWRDSTVIRADAVAAARSHAKSVWYSNTQSKEDGPASEEAAQPSRDVALIDTYGLSAEALAKLMLRWRQRALAAERDTSGRVDLLI